ncbi:MAG: SMI1/KNR4 family protein [bacterium]|nr:SMI1/KNR4 family protein [bacterium]
MKRDADWRSRLRQLREKPADCDFPLRTFTFGLPSGAPWPSSLPASPLISEFYSIIDGGWFGVDCDWYSLADLARKNDDYFQLLTCWNPDDSTPLQRERHLVFGHDASGNPYVWDAADDSVFLFDTKGTGWFKQADGFEQFLIKLLFPIRPDHEDDLWFDALRQLDTMDA